MSPYEHVIDPISSEILIWKRQVAIAMDTVEFKEL